MGRIVLLAVWLAPLFAWAEDTNVEGRLVVQEKDVEPVCTEATTGGELCVAGDAEVEGGFSVAGAATLSGATTVTGALTCGSGASIAGELDMGDNVRMNGNEIYHVRRSFVDKSVNYTVEPDDCGRVIATNDDNRIFTLPAASAASSGCVVRFINTADEGLALISISPNPVDGIYGTCCGEGVAKAAKCVHFSGVDDKDLRNTKSTQHEGDSVTLVSDGLTGWYTMSCTGVWESES